MSIYYRESPEGRCIAVIAIDFKNEEKYAIEKMQAMISGGDLAGMPVDDTYLIVNCKIFLPTALVKFQ